jgi:hypothetical protein
VSRLDEIVLDCAHPEALAPFWCSVLGRQVISSSPNAVELFPRPIDDETGWPTSEPLPSFHP